MIVPYDFPPAIGGDDSKQLSPADIRNMYMTRDDATGRISWKDLPGLKLIATGSGADRGHHVMAEERFVINAASLFKEDINGARSFLGTVTGGERAIFTDGKDQDDDDNLVLVANNNLYKYDGVFSTISQSVVDNPEWVVYLNETYIIGGDNQKFALSDVRDPDSWPALNFGFSDQKNDTLIRGYAFGGLLYLFGSLHTELWTYTGIGTPPISRRDGTIDLNNKGIIGKYAVTNSDKFIYWMGDDKKIYRGIGSGAKAVNTAAISSIIERYSVVDDCIASSYVLRGQTFVLFKFPSERDALLYSETNDYWIGVSGGTNREEREVWLGNDVQSVYNKNITTDFGVGSTYELDVDTFTDNGQNRLRMIVGNPITGAQMGLPENMITLSDIRIPMQSGVGLATGQGSDPTLQFQISNDGGHTYGPQDSVSFGEMGDYVKKVMLYQFATGYEIVPRVMVSDPVPVTFYTGGTADISDAGY